MPPIRTRKRRARHYTPPPDLCPQNEGHASTPRRAGVFWAKVYSQATGINIPTSVIESVTRIPPRTQSHILSTNHVRTTHNIEDSGPDPRAPKPAFTKSDTSAIFDYLVHPLTHIDDKGKPWQDIVVDAGVDLPQTRHFKPPGLWDMNPKGIQQSLKHNEGIINAVCEEETELPKRLANERIDWSITQRGTRPRSRHWKNVYFCNEFHFRISPQVTKHIKRPIGKK